MRMELRLILLLALGSVSSTFLQEPAQSQGILHNIYNHSPVGKSLVKRCRSNNGGIETEEKAARNSFLDLSNFLEYVQLTPLRNSAKEDAIKYFNLSVAAFEYGSYLVAQESFARAVGALENRNEVESRSVGRSGRYRNRDSARNATDIWDPADLFNEFRNVMGDQKFEQLLHLKRRVVTMAFVIDTSSSMENDMGHVREYINQLVVEQERTDTDATYVVTTFTDPEAGPTKVFHTKERLKHYLNNLQTSSGGDCLEKTCLGILRAMYNYNFIRKGNAAMYIFTDAGSKDCKRHASNIIRSFQFCKASAFFILFDSCSTNIDPLYVEIAQNTGGFCLLVRDNAVYNITDTVNGAFESDALICGEDTHESNSIVGQGFGPYAKRRGKRSIEDNSSNGHSMKKHILIDDLTTDFKVFVTIFPLELVHEVRLIKPLDGDNTLCSAVTNDTSVADNGIVFHVKAAGCPCVGNWTLIYPASADDSFTYSVKSIGDYTLSFDAYFVDTIAGDTVTNYAPCVEVEENLVIKLNQGDQVLTETLTAKIVGVAGNTLQHTARLQPHQTYQNTFVVKLLLPRDIGSKGFRIMLEGELLGGSKFQRQSTNTFQATISCLRLVSVNNYFALFPRLRTLIKFELRNNNPVDDVYTVLCSNTENYDISLGKAMMELPEQRRTRLVASNPILIPKGAKARYIVTLSVPRYTYLTRGKTVIVTCSATTATEEMIEMIRLTEMDEQFYD